MKAFSKTLLVSVFFFINFIGCLNPCGGDIDKVHPYFKIKDIYIYNQAVNGTAFKSNEEIRFTEHGLFIYISPKYYTHNSLMTGFNAIACSPLEPGYEGTNERISQIKITSDRDFDNKHNANTSLNDLILANTSFVAPKIPLNDYLKEIKNTPSINGILLYFSSAPSQKQSQIFTVEYTLTNGKTFSSKTLPIVIY
jgi:hypothetical protein